MSMIPRDLPAFPPRFSNGQARQHSRPRQLPRYRVVLLNNAAADMMFVVRTIMELTRFCRTEATHKMWEAHHRGRSLLLTTHRERAELYVEQFASKGLVVTIEPA
ncbi:MAG: ATP-dependent Clp protease adaptor ClpS [Gemmataceae bacterium]|nr:ATP-dependent Clp protease adaptor ClpS [Gemmataceae bacterium]